MDAIPYPTIEPPIFLPAPPRRRLGVRLPIAIAAVLTAVLLATAGFAGSQFMRPQPQPVAARAAEWQNYVDFAKTFTESLMTMSSAATDTYFDRLIDQSAGSLRQNFREKRDALVRAATPNEVTVAPKVNAAALKHFDSQQQVAEVLVSASYTKTAPGRSEPEVKAWRMTITVEDIKGALKASHLVVLP
ncbi:hypothetical protein OS121_28980 [Mycolicibacterium mucogenicum]|uniref:hypothetical protein n=1 Tax=Mycolicibacterium mucogenicum TaxID=56689 RepID=UPI00226AF50F|nr:hypothetical protein [Mycolicibacterium mucogenicum]MCX8559080.1 hypothetical protein [Mycolicibacterium mucogenicum]